MGKVFCSHKYTEKLKIKFMNAEGTTENIPITAPLFKQEIGRQGSNFGRRGLVWRAARAPGLVWRAARAPGLVWRAPSWRFGPILGTEPLVAYQLYLLISQIPLHNPVNIY